MKKYFATLYVCLMLAACSTPKHPANPSQLIILASLDALYKEQVATIKKETHLKIKKSERRLNKTLLEQGLNKALDGRRALPKSEAKVLTMEYAKQFSRERELIKTGQQQKLKQLKKYYFALVKAVKQNDSLIRKRQADNDETNAFLESYQSKLKEMAAFTATTKEKELIAPR